MSGCAAPAIVVHRDIGSRNLGSASGLHWPPRSRIEDLGRVAEWFKAPVLKFANDHLRSCWAVPVSPVLLLSVECSGTLYPNLSRIVLGSWVANTVAARFFWFWRHPSRTGRRSLRRARFLSAPSPRF